MKTQIAILALLMVLLTSGCSSDSSSSAANTDPIQGLWKLTNVTGTFAGINDNFAPGTITWNFNPITHTVSVVNNNTNPDLLDLFETGVYDFQIIDNPNPSTCSEIVKINGIEMGCFTVTDNTLSFDQSFADGMQVNLIH